MGFLLTPKYPNYGDKRNFRIQIIDKMESNESSNFVNEQQNSREPRKNFSKKINSVIFNNQTVKTEKKEEKV